MRNAATTALEVLGMISLSVALALLVGSAWVAFAGAGAALVAAGYVEGRRS